MQRLLAARQLPARSRNPTQGKSKCRHSQGESAGKNKQENINRRKQ